MKISISGHALPAGTLLAILLALPQAFAAPVPAPAAPVDRVIRWSALADNYGDGLVNWRTLAIMHQAMHDAANAVSPRFARWSEPAPQEPAAAGALPEAAMDAAAGQVLLELHPERRSDTEKAIKLALDLDEPGPARDASGVLGRAIGAAAVARRAHDGRDDIRQFAVGTGAGVWRTTPEEFGGSGTSSTVPFLFPARGSLSSIPPPDLDSDRYRRDLAEVREIGASVSTSRTKTQADAAVYWATQNSQRGFLHLALWLLDQHPLPGGPIEHARVLSQLTAALADSAIITWHYKEQFARWRPVTAIRTGSPGVEVDPQWLPFIETPPFPEYPSGHAADCFTASKVLQATFPDLRDITYVTQRGRVSTLQAIIAGPGQHMQPGAPRTGPERDFPSLAAAAEECADSRIWAGAHFRFANEESDRLAAAIAERALAAVRRLN